MANSKHVEILKQGVEIWDNWRKENPNIESDLSMADLSGANLHEAILIDANLSKTTTFIGNLLLRTDFSKGKLR